MGKIIAIGGGFDNDFLVRHVLSLCGGKKPNFLHIPTTCYDNRSTELYSRFFRWGCEVDMLFLTHDYVTEQMVAEKIRRADIINVPGGNLRFALEVWRKTHADRYLKEAYDEGKILFGDSSGSMCWFAEGYDDCGPEGEFMFVDCLGLLPYCNCPHYETREWQGFNEAVKTRARSGLACENQAAICFIDEQRYILHSPNRVDSRCWLFDVGDHFRRIDLTANPDVLASL